MFKFSNYITSIYQPVIFTHRASQTTGWLLECVCVRGLNACGQSFPQTGMEKAAVRWSFQTLLLLTHSWMRVGGLLGWFFSPGRSTVSWPPAGSAPPPPGAARAPQTLRAVWPVHVTPPPPFYLFWWVCVQAFVWRTLICHHPQKALGLLTVTWCDRRATGVFCTCVCISDGQRHGFIRTGAICHRMDTLMFDGSDGEVVYDLRAQTPTPPQHPRSLCNGWFVKATRLLASCTASVFGPLVQSPQNSPKGKARQGKAKQFKQIQICCFSCWFVTF